MGGKTIKYIHQRATWGSGGTSEEAEGWKIVKARNMKEV
jgi:hypothetical protein